MRHTAPGKSHRTGISLPILLPLFPTSRPGSHKHKKRHAGPEQRGNSQQEGPPGATTDIPQGVPVLLPRVESLTHFLRRGTARDT